MRNSYQIEIKISTTTNWLFYFFNWQWWRTIRNFLKFNGFWTFEILVFEIQRFFGSGFWKFKISTVFENLKILTVFLICLILTKGKNRFTLLNTSRPLDYDRLNLTSEAFSFQKNPSFQSNKLNMSLHWDFPADTPLNSI